MAEEMNWDKAKVLEMADTRVINYSGTTLCGNYKSPLKECKTATQALRLYKNCISWALQERYPTKEDLLAFADKDVLAENDIYIDREFSGERIDEHICCVFINCKGWITTGLNLDKAIIPMIYLSEGSDLLIKVDENLTRPIPVELYYGSKVKGDTKRLAVKDCNALTAKDNVGFTEEQLAIDPEINNIDL